MRESGLSLEETYARWTNLTNRTNLKNELIECIGGDNDFADFHLELVDKLFDVFTRRQLSSTSNSPATAGRKRRFADDSDVAPNGAKRQKVTASSSYIETGTDAFQLKRQLVRSYSCSDLKCVQVLKFLGTAT